ncbi:hypothetical protein NBRC116601_18300 [Cognatishimia sp. WU-CL00825]|uniref:RNA-directed DNA polymerase n=1 Tax=Cognatishimia sp. WU-CL00825 TaxID=3127658 RepID=UPI0031070425
MHNKDGKYAWRPQQIIHPVIYVALVNAITEPEGWDLVRSKFSEFAQDPRIECVSLPVESNNEQKDKAAQVFSWWQAMEQRSIDLSLDYSFVLNTDVADCYGSIYTHSIAWALHGKELAKSKEGRHDKMLLGNQLDFLIRSCMHNQTNGIPQGSNSMNLIAEIILGYADTQLSKAISQVGVSDFKILRYRDDYRIFTNSSSDAETIARLLTDVLRDLGMKLSVDKTSASREIIQSSVKEDKLFWIGKEKKKKSLVKHMLLIHELAKAHPNSGSIAVALSKFQKRIHKLKETDESIHSIVAALTDVALENPRIYPLYAAILSKLLSLTTFDESEELLGRILKKFERVPYSGHLHIWLNRFVAPMGLSDDFNEPLCLALHDRELQIWNSDWLPSDFQPLLAAHQFVDRDAFDNLKSVIKPKEVQLFGYQG